MARIGELPDLTYIGYESDASGGIRTSQSEGESFTIQARDLVNDSWTTYVSVSAGESPTCLIAGATFDVLAGVANQPLTLKPGDAAGTNVAGGAMNIRGGSGSGNAAPGSINFSTSTAVGTGATVQTQTDRWQITSLGYFRAVADNTYDIGQSGANRPRTGYFGTSVVTPHATLGGNTVTDNAPPLIITQTWNDTDTFTAVDINVNQGSSAGASRLQAWRIGGADKAVITKDGTFRANGVGGPGEFGTLQISPSLSGTDGLAEVAVGGITIRPQYAFGWSGNPNNSQIGNRDLALFRDDTNQLAQRNGTAAQIHRVYRTYTSSNTFERLALQTGSGYVELAAESQSGGGAGANFDVRLTPVGTGVVRTNSKLQVEGGVAANGSGMKHARVPTPSVAANNGTAVVSVSWGTAFPDTSYTVVASVLDTTVDAASLRVIHVESITTGGVTVRVQNTHLTNAITGTVHVIAIHD